MIKRRLADPKAEMRSTVVVKDGDDFIDRRVKTCNAA
jgi:hypothetical protein